MAETYKTPGVYINEINAFPNSVVEVPTAVPAFIGYTEKAQRGQTDLTLKPTRISSFSEFAMYFGGPPAPQYTYAPKPKPGEPSLQPVATSRFLLYYGMKFFFNNGGGPCWIVSIGGYTDDSGKPVTKAGSDFEAALAPLTKEQEPTMLVAPDAVLLPINDWAEFSNLCVAQCIAMQSRVAILDVYDGDKQRNFDPDTDVISGAKVGIRSKIVADKMHYAMAYYPWVNTSIVEAQEIDFLNFEEKSRSDVAAAVKADPVVAAMKPDTITALVKPLTEKYAPPKTPAEAQTQQTQIRSAHNALLAMSPVYTSLIAQLQEAINLMPPAVGMAGVYTRTDNEFGVFKAPANTGLVSVVSPAVTVSHDEQEDLNVPLDGKAINAIRSFVGRGVLVWGARTMDGNSQDWRYINVRRTMIMLEQSIKAACEAYAFAPNDDGTWLMVRTMIENFLNNQWKAGALAGAKPQDAYGVNVGLGSTMTPNDILDGYMRVTVHVAVVRPAEFIVITFQQKMQTS